MTASEAIERADSVKPNAFTEEEEFNWLVTLDSKIAMELFLMSPQDMEQIRLKYPEDLNSELLVNYPHDEIYPLYLMARIDEMNGEYNKYANSSAIFNDYYSQFSCWFLQAYDPVQGYINREELWAR